VALLDDAPLLRPGVQRVNCSVALAAVRCFLEERVPADGVSISWEDIRQAIGRFSWPGRYQKIVEGWNYWFLDGAHNEMGVERAAHGLLRSRRNIGTGSRYDTTLVGLRLL
jgi:folylpolyglutamate synthase